MGRIGVTGEELDWKDEVVGKNNIIGVMMAEATPFLPRTGYDESQSTSPHRSGL